jgi:hypothetical protein
MTFPVFSPGEVLRAQDMNAVGMWEVASGALSSSGTNFVGCFTADYRNYRIVLDNLFISANTDFCWQGLVGSTAQTASSYWVAALGFSSGGAAYNQNNSNVNPGRTIASSVGSDRAFELTMDIFRPQLATYTLFNAHFSQFQTDDFRFRTGSGGYTPTTQLDGIRFLSAGGQTISGNVTIYGYNP